MLKSITKGTIFGAGLGATAGAVYGVAHQFLNAKPVKTDLDFLDSDGELVYLCDEIHRIVNESGKFAEAKPSLDIMKKSLNPIDGAQLAGGRVQTARYQAFVGRHRPPPR